MEEKAAETVPAPAVAVAAAGDLDVTYCSEHPYPPGAAAAAGMAVGSGICAFCLQEKLGMLVSSSKSSPFHPPPASVTPTTPPSTNMPASDPPHPPAAAVPPQKAKSSSSSAATVASGLRRSKSVAPRPDEPPLSAAGVANDSPRKKSFWSFLYPSSGAHRSASSSSSSLPGADGPASARRKSVSVASSAASASMGRRLEAIEEPESPGRRSEGSSSSSFGRKVARSRSVGCGSRSFSGDFLERLSTGFGDCALRRVESHREPKPKGAAPGHLGDGGDDDYEQHKIKCAGFFGGLGAAPPPSSSYWLSAPGNAGNGAGAGTGGGSGKAPGARSHRSWAWALASPMRALRPTSSTSSKSIMSAHHNRAAGGANNMPTVGGSAVATS
ncbi:translation initiation factor IF-2-like [Lolium rigidum]|uniref:translation initiation factor IF-2-like n=1 Tax=Lolium rigidum TaxID=89674 RepID=UPI001F5C0F9D|nr:translation initiation factor IF-2-like [Lolium rigidum]